MAFGNDRAHMQIEKKYGSVEGIEHQSQQANELKNIVARVIVL